MNITLLLASLRLPDFLLAMHFATETTSFRLSLSLSV